MMDKEMKGITYCGECIYYNKKKHRCTVGASVETDPRRTFYDDCPLPEVAPVVRCKDCKYYEIHKPSVLENCERNGILLPMKPDDFCAYGERRSNG